MISKDITKNLKSTDNNDITELSKTDNMYLKRINNYIGRSSKEVTEILKKEICDESQPSNDCPPCDLNGCIDGDGGFNLAQGSGVVKFTNGEFVKAEMDSCKFGTDGDGLVTE